MWWRYSSFWRGWPIRHCCVASLIHWRCSIVDRAKGCTSGSLSYCNGLRGNSRNVNTIRSSEQHGGSGVYFIATITVIWHLCEDYAFKLIDEAWHNQASSRSSKAAIGVAPTYQPDESVNAVVGMIETEQEDWMDEVLDNRIVGRLNVQFENMLADDSSDLSWRSGGEVSIIVNLFHSTNHQHQPCSFYNQHDDNRQSAAKRTNVLLKMPNWHIDRHNERAPSCCWNRNSYPASTCYLLTLIILRVNDKCKGFP